MCHDFPANPTIPSLPATREDVDGEGRVHLGVFTGKAVVSRTVPSSQEHGEARGSPNAGWRGTRRPANAGAGGAIPEKQAGGPGGRTQKQGHGLQ